MCLLRIAPFAARRLPLFISSASTITRGHNVIVVFLFSASSRLSAQLVLVGCTFHMGQQTI